MAVKPEPEKQSASLLTLPVLPTSRPLLITDTHRQARGGAAHRLGGIGLMLGKPHDRKTGGIYAPSFDWLGIGVSFFGFDLRRQVFGEQPRPARQ
jgi:hypothetical protein